MDPRQARREKHGADKPVKRSGTSHAGSPADALVPNPMLPQGKNHQALNHNNFQEQPAGNLGIDGDPRLHPFGDSIQENDGRDGYVSGNVPPSGTPQGYLGFRGQNLPRQTGQVMDTEASQYDKLDMDYNGMQALNQANKNYASSRDKTPSYNLGGMGMMGTAAMTANPQLQEPPTRMEAELGMTGMSAAGKSLSMQPVGGEMVPGSTPTKIQKKKGKK